MTDSFTIDTSNTEGQEQETNIKSKIVDTVPANDTNEIWIQPGTQFTIPIQNPRNKCQKYSDFGQIKLRKK